MPTPVSPNVCVTTGSPAASATCAAVRAPAMPASKRGSSCRASAAPWRITASVPSSVMLDSCARIGTGERARSRASSAGIAGRQGLLGVLDAEVAEALQHAQRERGRPGRIRVDADARAVSHRGAHGAHARLVDVRREADLEVHRPEAALDPGQRVLGHLLGVAGDEIGVEGRAVAPRSAPEPVQRLARDAADDVPERGVDTRERPRDALRAEVRHAGLGVEAAPDDVGLERIGADDEVLDARDQRPRDVGLPGPHDRRLADAGHAFVGLDLHEHGLQRGRAVPAAPPARLVGTVLRDGDDRLADLGDPHRAAPEAAGMVGSDDDELGRDAGRRGGRPP